MGFWSTLTEPYLHRHPYAKTEASRLFTTFSDDIRTEFGLKNCAMIVLKKRQLVHSQNLVLGFNREIQELEQGKT